MSKSEKYTPDNYDAFISYKHQTGFYMAQVIYDKLVQNGYSVYMDKHLKRGQYEPQIKLAVEKSRNFILVLFPGDLDSANNKEDWLRKESEWATNTPNMNFIPVFCEEFDIKDIKVTLPKSLKTVLASQGVKVHKDTALDSDLDKLCDAALVNANPVRPLITTTDFFKNNLNDSSRTIKSIDMAFHGGGAWLRTGKNKDILNEIIDRKIPTRILINTPKAAESIAKHMRDDDAIYFSFKELQKRWKKFMKEHSDVIEVRATSVPLLRVYHNFKFNEDSSESTYDRMHIKYYVYKNLNLENSFEHELSTFSKYYDMYKKEFEFLWNSSTPI